MNNSAISNLANNVAASPVEAGTTIWIVGITVLILAALIGTVYIYRETIFGGKRGETVAQTPSTLPVAAPAAPAAETWCLVGEDLSGRYCVRVPSEHSCDPNRTYGTRHDCELTPANTLPAGIQKAGGQGIQFLSSLKLE